MPNLRKLGLLDDLRERFGDVRKLKGSESLFVIGNEAARIYFRYSKVHERGRTFFGLRQVDLRQLEGHNSYLCFVTDKGSLPVFLPYADFEEVFANSEPARDGQYKVQLLTKSNTLELYVARQGRFNVEGYVGLDVVERGLDAQRLREAQTLSHSQVQTLIAGIGHAKGYDVYVPEYDIGRLDWSLTKSFSLRRQVPEGYNQVRGILSEIDVVWIARGRNDIEGLYEVEHSTPLYSGLLRFNDVLLTSPGVTRFSIVSNDVGVSCFRAKFLGPRSERAVLPNSVAFWSTPMYLLGMDVCQREI